MRRNTMAMVRQSKILLVDPHPTELERLSSELRQLGFRVVAVSRHDAVIPLFRAFGPDAVVLAAQAPHFEAVQVVRRLRRSEPSTTPFLFIVDAPDPELRNYCFSKGLALDALPRPVSGLELGSKLNALLSWREAIVRRSLDSADEVTPTLHDVETGLFNRRYLLSLIEHEIRRAQRHGGSFTVAVGTLQPMNVRDASQSRGLVTQALAELGPSLAGSLRELDVLARIGPRSFGLLMPALDSEHEGAVVHRLQERLEQLRLPLAGGQVSFGVSLGTASFPEVLGPSVMLLNRAQAAQQPFQRREQRMTSSARVSPHA